MEVKEQMNKLRKEIDGIDGEIVSLFAKRMELAKQAAEVKGKNNLSIFDQDREQQIVDRAASMAGLNIKGETSLLLRTILALSREWQRKMLFRSNAKLLPEAHPPKKDGITCAYQGVPGAWSEQAAASLYPNAGLTAVDSFEDVFITVKEKRTDYGVVPIENSKTGAIGETYDLLRKYGCYIVGKTRVGIRHCLMAVSGVKPEDIREVFSHPEALKQCHNFLKGRSWDLTASRNTAMAAEHVATSRKKQFAAIGSHRAAALNGLEVLAEDISDDPSNHTYFVVIALRPEYDEKSDTVSITFATQHRSGALCEALLPFMSFGINMMRIESRPSKMGNYRFFIDLEGNIGNSDMIDALWQTASSCEYLEVTGCYKNT